MYVSYKSYQTEKKFFLYGRTYPIWNLKRKIVIFWCFRFTLYRISEYESLPRQNKTQIVRRQYHVRPMVAIHACRELSECRVRLDLWREVLQLSRSLQEPTKPCCLWRFNDYIKDIGAFYDAEQAHRSE